MSESEIESRDRVGRLSAREARRERKKLSYQTRQLRKERTRTEGTKGRTVGTPPHPRKTCGRYPGRHPRITLVAPCVKYRPWSVCGDIMLYETDTHTHDASDNTQVGDVGQSERPARREAPGGLNDDGREGAEQEVARRRRRAQRGRRGRPEPKRHPRRAPP